VYFRLLPTWGIRGVTYIAKFNSPDNVLKLKKMLGRMWMSGKEEVDMMRFIESSSCANNEMRWELR